jgi:ketosteroid isomerase-like protein
MSENLDLVRSIFADWERGDFSSAEWADPEIEFVQADGPDPSRSTGLAAMAAAWRRRRHFVADMRVEAEEYRELVDGRVLVLVRNRGIAKASGIDLEQIRRVLTAFLCRLSNGKVTSITLYWDRDNAFADLGLEG